jgi:hypothetical protein
MIRIAFLFGLAFLGGCSKTDGERCVESYMKLFDDRITNPTPEQRQQAKEAYTRRCTDPNFGE